jgi:formamidopyrimidine-DNA glycosylase
MVYVDCETHHWWFGCAYYAEDPAEHPMISRLGLHGLELSLEQFRLLFEGRRGSIKAFPRARVYIAGIGNACVQNPLFWARLHPLTAFPSLTASKTEMLGQAPRDTLQESIDQGGAGYERNLYGQQGGRVGEFLLVAYPQGSPYPLYGATVTRIRTGSTSSCICPACQPLP